MSKYINANELKLILNREHLNYSQMIEKKFVLNAIDKMPSADVVDVETLKKNIEAYIDEARELRDEHSSELIRAFQQGRMFGHKCDLEMIKKRESECRLRDYPSADVRENKHCEWKSSYRTWEFTFECSACGKENYEESNFCPNCGADMRGEIE